jgi:hypothetical protein
MWEGIYQGEQVMGEISRSYIEPVMVSEMIRIRLSELLPGFDSDQLEHKMWEMAVEDFLNYLRHVWSVELQDWMSEQAEWEEPTPIQKLKSLIVDWLEKDPKTAKEDLNAWVSLWLVKWKQRVKLIFGDEGNYNQNCKQVQTLIQKGSQMMGYEELKLFREPILFTLISHGEITGTEVLTDHILKREAGKLKHGPKGIKEKADFLAVCMRETRILSQIAGKFIFIKVADSKAFRARKEVG